MFPRPQHTTASGPGAAAFGGPNYGSVITQVTALDGISLGLVRQDVDALSIEDFTGRTWLFDELAAFRTACASGYLVVEAAAGLGKTSFALEIAKQPHHVAHFTKIEGGASRRSALLNLSSQLITALDLFPDIEREFVLPEIDRTWVPEWSGEPEHFAKLLRLAAAKAVANGHSLTVVVDGMDEEDPPSVPVPLGLPARPPPGVHVVATLRSGTPITLAETDSRVVHIVADDPRNLADMRTYLLRVAEKPDARAMLTRHGVSATEFTDMLIERCEGVWIHLRYLLADIHSGEVGLDNLDQLPPKLSHYFAHSLLRRRTAPTWADVDLPVLSALGAVAEPVTAHMLGDVAKVSAPAVRSLCERRYRAFLRVDRTNGGRRFSVAHRSFGEFLASPAAHDLPDAVLDLRDELAERVTAMQGELADHYIAAFRDRRSGFTRLHEGYGLRRCPTHLRAADRHAELRALLLPESGWLALQRRHGDLNAYTQDLIAELEVAAELVDAAPALSPNVEPLVFEMFASLFLAGRTAVPGDVPVDLVGPLVESAAWTVDEAFDHLGTVTNPQLLASGLLGLLPHLSGARYTRCVARIRVTAAKIPAAEDRADVHTRLATQDDDPAILLTDMAAIRAPAGKVDALLNLAARMPSRRDTLRDEALAVLAEIPDPATRAVGLARSASLAPVGEAERLAINALTAADDADHDRRVDDAILPEFDLYNSLTRTDVAASLLRCTPDTLRQQLWDEVRAAQVPDGMPGFSRQLTLAEFAPDPTDRNNLLHEAIARARAVPDIRTVAAAMQEILRVLRRQ